MSISQQLTFITVGAWLKKYFPDGGPHARTVQRWARSGQIPARRIGRVWLLNDLPPGDQVGEATNSSAAIEAGRRAAIERMISQSQ